MLTALLHLLCLHLLTSASRLARHHVTPSLLLCLACQDHLSYYSLSSVGMLCAAGTEAAQLATIWHLSLLLVLPLVNCMFYVAMLCAAGAGAAHDLAAAFSEGAHRPPGEAAAAAPAAARTHTCTCRSLPHTARRCMWHSCAVVLHSRQQDSSGTMCT